MQSGGSSAPTPPWIAYNADRSEITASDLTGLTDGRYLFYRWYKLLIFRIDLPYMTYGEAMFFGCVALRMFIGDISAVGYGVNMFDGCTSLTVFSSDLLALNYGNGMFNKCKLDKISILRILNTIPAYTSGTHSLTLGMDASLNGDADIAAALTAAREKGWTVTAQYN